MHREIDGGREWEARTAAREDGERERERQRERERERERERKRARERDGVNVEWAA